MYAHLARFCPLTYVPSLSVQVIFRGARPAGYGFVAFKSAEAAQKAVDLLNKEELDGRTLIVEIAKPAAEKEKKEKRPSKKRAKKVKGEADASPTVNGANGDAAETKESGETPASTEGKSKKKKRTVVSTLSPEIATGEDLLSLPYPVSTLLAQAQKGKGSCQGG